jgi:SAM-dependent methyltransferase
VTGAELAVPEAAIWHDVECGSYGADHRLWRELAERHGDPILEVGAGTGRVAHALARHGHQVTALDVDATLIGVLRQRAAGLDLDAVVADARSFRLTRRFALIVAAMQTIQLFGGRRGRVSFLRCARRHLAAGGVVAIAITEEPDIYEAADGLAILVPDMAERDGVVYSSQPTAVRKTRGGFALERRRERILPDGSREQSNDTVIVAALTADGLEREGEEAGLVPKGRRRIGPTSDHVGSVVVILDG